MNYIKINKEIIDHWLFQNADFFRAWVWMLVKANWKKGSFLHRKSGEQIEVSRGQFFTTERCLATAFGWSRTKVKTFLERLKTDKIIDHKKDQNGTLISICNYDKYQNLSLVKEPQKRPDRSIYISNNNINNLDISNNNILSGSSEDFSVSGSLLDIRVEASPEVDKFNALLEIPNDQVWTNTNQFLMLGRRPVQKYPLIFATAQELYEVFEMLKSHGVESKAKVHEYFKFIHDYCKERIAEGTPIERLRGVHWLNTFIGSFMERLASTTKAQRQGLYLVKAKGGR